MSTLPRVKPGPTPAIHPLPEYLAEGQRREWYEGAKQVLQVPWMGVVTMAFAHYPSFYDSFWRGVRDLCASRPFVDACRANRDFAEARVTKLDPESVPDRLRDLGYAPREIEDIRNMVEIFSHGNQAYVLLATICRWLLEAGEMAGSPDPEAAPLFDGRHAPDVEVPFVLMEAHHADQPTRDVYEDVKQVLGLPFVNTDYRAFARWPSYWALAWNDLREVVGTTEHETICRELHERCVEQVAATLPNPGRLSADALRKAAGEDAPVEEVRDVCRLFQWLLPGLITNVAYLRAQLHQAR